MPQFDPELVRVMRNVLEEAMTRVPLEISNTTTKAYLAECILKTAAQGHTAYNELLSAATDQIQVIVSISRERACGRAHRRALTTTESRQRAAEPVVTRMVRFWMSRS